MNHPVSDNFKINDPKVIRAWAFYDWANSAFALVITTAIFPAYYLAITNDMIEVFGLQVSNSALYAFTITVAYIILTLVSPLLSGIADYSGKKKQFLLFFTLLGSFSCIGLFFFSRHGTNFIGNPLIFIRSHRFCRWIGFLQCFSS